VYPAEGVATVVEVKSNIADQRDQALETGRKVKALQPIRIAQFVVGSVPDRIPVVAVGFGGWTKSAGAMEMVASTYVDAVYEIEAGRLACTLAFAGLPTGNTVSIEGPPAMLMLLAGIRRSVTQLLAAEIPPLRYC
jgi:hypothetical protein